MRRVDGLRLAAGSGAGHVYFDEIRVATNWYAMLDMPIPGLAVLGNGVQIGDGDATPSAADHTDFGALKIDHRSRFRTVNTDKMVPHPETRVPQENQPCRPQWI